MPLSPTTSLAPTYWSFGPSATWIECDDDCWILERPMTPSSPRYSPLREPPQLDIDWSTLQIPWADMMHTVGTHEYTLEEDRAFQLAFLRGLPPGAEHVPYPTQYAAEVALRRRGCIFQRAAGPGYPDCTTRVPLEHQTGGCDLYQKYCVHCRVVFLGHDVPEEMYRKTDKRRRVG